MDIIKKILGKENKCKIDNNKKIENKNIVQIYNEDKDREDAYAMAYRLDMIDEIVCFINK